MMRHMGRLCKTSDTLMHEKKHLLWHLRQRGRRFYMVWRQLVETMHGQSGKTGYWNTIMDMMNPLQLSDAYRDSPIFYHQLILLSLSSLSSSFWSTVATEPFSTVSSEFALHL